MARIPAGAPGCVAPLITLQMRPENKVAKG
jgi:hypothetical protein